MSTFDTDSSIAEENHRNSREELAGSLAATWKPFIAACEEWEALFNSRRADISKVREDGVTAYISRGLMSTSVVVKYKHKKILDLRFWPPEGEHDYRLSRSLFVSSAHYEQLRQILVKMRQDIKAYHEAETYKLDADNAFQQLTFNKNSFTEAEITGETLTHTVHTEDLLAGGSKAAEFAMQALYSVFDMLQGSTPKEKLNVTCKWDGAPSCAAASNFHGQKFVATKGFFAKDRKIAYTPEDCDALFGHAPDLAKKMKALLGLLDDIQIPADQVWQGDFLFDKDSLKTETIDGEKCVTFHPNTIVYAVPANDPLARAMQAAEVGVVWHTRYRGEDFDSLKIAFDADADELATTPKAFCMDARLPSIAGKVTLTDEETRKVSALLEKATELVDELTASDALDKVTADEELHLYLNTFENYVIKARMQQLDKAPDAYLKEMRDWVAARYDKEIASKKQPKTQQAYTDRKNQALAKIDELAPELVKILQAQKIIVTVKEFLIAKLNRAGSFKTLFKTLDKGYVPTGHEGYAISDIDGNIQKFVSRLEFSYGNFSKEIVKGWMSDKRMQENKLSKAYSRSSEPLPGEQLDLVKGESVKLEERRSVPELKQGIVAAVNSIDDPEPLVQALNALEQLDLETLKALLRDRFEVASTLDRVASTLLYRRPSVENADYLNLLTEIAREGIVSADENRVINFGQEAFASARALASRLGIAPEDADATVKSLFENLLYDSFPQNGIVVGKGEILFALLVKEGSKRLVGDLTIAGAHVEVKGINAKLVGASGQGGLIGGGKPSVVGARIRRLISIEVPSIDQSLLALPAALDVYADGPPLLKEAMSKLDGATAQKVAQQTVELMTSLVAVPAGSSRPAEMLSALLAKDWLAFRNAYLKLNYEAYAAGAGWDKLLVFNGDDYNLLITSSAEDFVAAVMRGEVAIRPFSFSSGMKAAGTELLVGFGMKLLPAGSAYSETRSLWKSEEQRAADEAAKLSATLTKRFATAKAAIAQKQRALAAVTAPAKRRKAEASLKALMQKAKEIEMRLKELGQ